MSAPFRLVIADDHDEIRRLLEDWLVGDERFEVAGEAADGAAAVHLAEKLQPDAVLLDLRMPVMSGEEAMARIRKVAPGAAVVVLSGDADLLEKAKRLRADGVFPKGGSIAAALDALAAAVIRRRMTKAQAS